MLKSLIPTKYEHVITKVIIKMNFRYPLNEMVMWKPIIKDLIYKQLHFLPEDAYLSCSNLQVCMHV